MNDETEIKFPETQSEPVADIQAMANRILDQADANGTPKFTMVGQDGPVEPVPEPEKIMVPINEAAAFVVTCNQPNMIADAYMVYHRSLAKVSDQVMERLSQACGPETITKLEDLDAKFENTLIGLQYNVPVIMEPPGKDVTAVEVVQRQIVAPMKLSAALEAIMRRVITVETLMDTLVQTMVTRASVSSMHMCAITMIDKDGKVGGTVINNPSMPTSSEQVTILYETMKNHAEEFKRSCEKSGVKISSLIIPSGAQVADLTGRTGITGTANQLPRGQRRR
jgi:hypothetical protein